MEHNPTNSSLSKQIPEDSFGFKNLILLNRVHNRYYQIYLNSSDTAKLKTMQTRQEWLPRMFTIGSIIGPDYYCHFRALRCAAPESQIPPAVHACDWIHHNTALPQPHYHLNGEATDNGSRSEFRGIFIVAEMFARFMNVYHWRLMAYSCDNLRLV